jgi:two-component system NtrC family sensor kinase
VTAKQSRTTARRIAAAFGVVLLLFALALVVMIVALEMIGAAEREVARLDRAKHAGHHAAAMAREQYMHQAHTLLAWDGSHLDHYYDVAEQAKHAIHHLETEIAGHHGQDQAKEIARLILQSDKRFREEVWPAIERGERDRMPELHSITERPVEEVVSLNTKLNTALEGESDVARREADEIREQARIAVIACFAFAIVAAMVVGFFLLRSISRPVAALRSGALRIGAGDLSARIDMKGSDELAELGHAFDQMASDLGRHQAELLEAHRLASIGQVASGVAHELNNPLGVILGYVTLLRRDGEREELRIIEDETRQAQAIVAGLLELARPVKLDRAEIDLGDVLREAASRLEESGRAEGVSIRVREGRCPRVNVDEGKVRQIAINLLGNAIDAARDATTTEIEVACGVRDGRAWIDVLDRGPGVSPEAKERIFEPFFTTRARGHGLGLAIARTLARAHGGDIELDAREGGGTRASLCLPLEAKENAA